MATMSKTAGRLRDDAGDFLGDVKQAARGLRYAKNSFLRCLELVDLDESQLNTARAELFSAQKDVNELLASVLEEDRRRHPEKERERKAFLQTVAARRLHVGKRPFVKHATDKQLRAEAELTIRDAIDNPLPGRKRKNPITEDEIEKKIVDFEKSLRRVRDELIEKGIPSAREAGVKVPKSKWTVLYNVLHPSH